MPAARQIGDARGAGPGMAWLCALLLAGCGTRSALSTDSGSGAGSGGGPAVVSSSSSSGGGAAGGAGGDGGQGGEGGSPPPPCTIFKAVGAPRSFYTQPSYRTFDARLLASSPDGQSVSLVVHADMPPFDDVPLLLDQVTFQPWQGWPDAVLGQHVLLLNGGAFGVATPRRPEPGITFLMGYYIPLQLPPTLVYAAEASTTQPSPPTLSLDPGTSAAPLFVTSGDSGTRVLGYRHFDSGTYHTTFAMDTGGMLSPLSGYACGNKAPAADAVRMGNHFIVALSNDGPFGACDGNNTADELQLARFELGQPPQYLGTPLTHPSSFAWIDMLPRSDGAWVLAQPSSPPHAPITAFRIDTDGNALTSDFELTQQDFTAAPYGFGMVGDDLWRVRQQPMSAMLVLERHDDEGAIVEQLLFESTPPLPPAPFHRISMLGSPDGQQFLLAYTSHTETAQIEGDAQTFVFRFSCTGI